MREFKKFPCTVFVLGNNFRIKKVEVTRGTQFRGITANDSFVWPSECHATHKAALAYGERRIKSWGKSIQELQKQIDKYTAVLKEESGEVVHAHKPVKMVKVAKPTKKVSKK